MQPLNHKTYTSDGKVALDWEPKKSFNSKESSETSIFKAPKCAISSAKKIASERRFSLRFKGPNLIPTAEFPAISESAAKVASERRCAILVHSEFPRISSEQFGPSVDHKMKGFSIVMGEGHQTKASTEQAKIVLSAPLDNFWTFSDILSTFSDILSTFPFLGCPTVACYNFNRNSPQKVHPNFAQNLGRHILGNTFSSCLNKMPKPLAISNPTP